MIPQHPCEGRITLFRGGENWAQRSQVICLRSPSWEKQSQNVHSGLRASGPCFFPLPRADPLAWSSRESRPPLCRGGDGSSQLGGQDCTGQLSEGLGLHREAAVQTLPLEMHPTCSSWVGMGTT